MSRALLLGCHAVARAHGRRALLDGLSFGLLEGDHADLVGPTGSGKSTLLRILAGLETPDRGSRAIRGVSHDRYSEFRARGLGISRRGRALRRNLGLFRPEQLDVPVGGLSGGEPAHTLVARRMGEPADLLVLDEPTNGLDIAALEVLEDSLVEVDGGPVPPPTTAS